MKLFQKSRGAFCQAFGSRIDLQPNPLAATCLPGILGNADEMSAKCEPGEGTSRCNHLGQHAWQVQPERFQNQLERLLSRGLAARPASISPHLALDSRRFFNPAAVSEPGRREGEHERSQRKGPQGYLKACETPGPMGPKTFRLRASCSRALRVPAAAVVSRTKARSPFSAMAETPGASAKLSQGYRPRPNPERKSPFTCP